MTAHKRVLLVEDDRDTSEMMKHYLEVIGYSVTVVSVASTAETIIENSEYEYFIVDLGLVGGDGKALLHKIHRLHPKYREKTVVHTSRQLNEHERLGIAALAGNIVRKSITSTDEIACILG